MANYQGPRGALFFNREKQAGSNQPDHTGDIEFDRDLVTNMVDQLNNGAQFAKVRLAGWARQSDKAGDFISVKASEPRPNKEEVQPAPQPAPQNTVSDDKIPF